MHVNQKVFPHGGWWVVSAPQSQKYVSSLSSQQALLWRGLMRLACCWGLPILSSSPLLFSCSREPDTLPDFTFVMTTPCTNIIEALSQQPPKFKTLGLWSVLQCHLLRKPSTSLQLMCMLKCCSSKFKHGNAKKFPRALPLKTLLNNINLWYNLG